MLLHLLRRFIKAILDPLVDDTKIAIDEVKQRVEDAGFTWALDRPTGEPFEISTTRAVINAYRLWARGLLPYAGSDCRGMAWDTQLPQSVHPLRHGVVCQDL